MVFVEVPLARPQVPTMPSGEPLAKILLRIWHRFGIRGVVGEERRRMGMYCAPFANLPEAQALMAATAPAQGDEFDDLVGLLLDHRCDERDETRWLAYAIAGACFGADHLWQDMGLPDRNALNKLLRRYFPELHAKNTGNMKWKKFFYKQVCDRMGLNLCKAPTCSACTEYTSCFVDPSEPLLPSSARNPTRQS